MEGERGGGSQVGRSFGSVGRRYGDRVCKETNTMAGVTKRVSRKLSKEE
jgi:hypothetical protein